MKSDIHPELEREIECRKDQFLQFMEAVLIPQGDGLYKVRTIADAERRISAYVTGHSECYNDLKEFIVMFLLEGKTLEFKT